MSLLGLLLLPAAAQAAPKTVTCGEGVKVVLSAASPRQGGVVLVMVRSRAPLDQLRGEWNGRALEFWRGTEPSDSPEALVGIDLNQKAEAFPLTLSAALEKGGRLACSALVRVRKGKFAIEKLKVAKGFVELSPEDETRAERESRRLREIFAGVTPERYWQGAFREPLGDVKGAGNFGRRRILNGQPRSPHSGEDFPAPEGTPIHAPARGRVVLADNLFFSGNTVVLDHGLGLYTFYGHLSSIAVKEGEMVEAGTLLGKVGATGRVTGPHLHWAVRLNQARVNPLALVAALRGAD